MVGGNAGAAGVRAATQALGAQTGGARTLLTVVQTVESSIPAPLAACLAGAWPRPAERTLPMITSLMSSAWRPARLTAPLMAVEPSCVAGSFASAPVKQPIGVRAMLAMTTSLCGATAAMPRRDAPSYGA